MSELIITQFCDESRILPKNSKPDILNTLVKVHADLQNTIRSRDEVKNILKNLEIDSLFIEYLVDHRAITFDDASKLITTESIVDQSSKTDMLLDCLEYRDIPENGKKKLQVANLVLLVNALRNTGQHELASKLDCSRRIMPSPLPSLLADNSGYYNESYDGGSKVELDTTIRRRGQLQIWIQVSAIKVCQKDYEHILPSLTEKEATVIGRSRRSCNRRNRAHNEKFMNRLGKCDIGNEFDVGPLKHFFETQHGASFWIDLESVQYSVPYLDMCNSDTATHLVQNREPNKLLNISAKLARNCLNFLFCCCKHASKKQDSSSIQTGEQFPPQNPINGSVVDYRLPSFVLPLSSGYVERKSISIVTTSNSKGIVEKQEHIRDVKLHILHEKSSHIYSRILDPTSISHDKLVKFLEQNCGVLVLGLHLENNACDEHSIGDVSTFIPACAIKPHSAVVITIVATTLESVRKLFSSVVIEPTTSSTEKVCTDVNFPVSTSYLSRDLEAILAATLASDLSDSALKLSIALKTDDIRSALFELSV